MRLPEDKRSGLGKEIKRLRLLRGFTQEQLEERSGVGQSTISALENGRQDQTSIEYLRRLAQALDVSINVLLNAGGLMEDLAQPPSEDDPLWVMMERVRAHPDLMRQLRALEEASDPETFDLTIAAVAEAWLANLRMGISVAEAQRARGARGSTNGL